MKDINQFITERGPAPIRKFKYCVQFSSNVGFDRLLTNNWKETVSQEPVSKSKYWEVMDMDKPNFSEVGALIAWHGKGGYWANVYDDSKDPENAPSWGTILKDRDLEKLERCKQ